MHSANHVSPDHLLDLANAVELSKEEGRVAWERAYEELHAKLSALGQDGTLYVVFGLQGGGKTTWIQLNASKFGPHAVFLEGPLPSSRHRERALAIAKAIGCRCVAVWVDTPYDVALARNAGRPGLSRIREETMLHVFHALEPPSLAEGFAEILHVTSAERDA